MRTLRCKCGDRTAWTTDGFQDCQGCPKCNTTYAGHPDGHKELQPHTWGTMYNENTGKPYKRCTKCYEIDDESYKEAKKRDEVKIDSDGKISQKWVDNLSSDDFVGGAKVYDKPAQLAPDPEPIVPTSTPVPLPVDLDDALRILYDQLESELDKIYELSEKEFLGQAHHGLGRFLRNEWGLWTGSDIQRWFKERGIHHADDMSGIILTSFHRKLHGKDIDLDKQIKHYIKYWNIHNPNVNKGIM